MDERKKKEMRKKRQRGRKIKIEESLGRFGERSLFCCPPSQP